MKWKSILAAVGLAVALSGSATIAASAPATAAPVELTILRTAPAVPDDEAAHDAADVGTMAIPDIRELDYVPIQPCRVVDTRAQGGVFAPGASRDYYVAGTAGFAPQGGQTGGCGIPESALSVTGTMIAFPKGDGYLRAWPRGTAAPTATVMAYDAGRISSGFTTTVTSGSGTDLTVRAFTTPTHLVIDVTGYYVPKMAVYLNSEGAVQDQSGRLLSATKTSTGRYSLTWDRPVGNCVGTGSSDVVGHIVSVYTSGSISRIYVVNDAGTPEDYWTNVLITC